MGTQKRKRDAVFAGEKKNRKEAVQEELHQLWKGRKA